MGTDAPRWLEEARTKPLTLQASEMKFADVFDVAPDGILLVDAEGEILLANAQANRMFGYDSLVGHAVDGLLPPEVWDPDPEKRGELFESPRVLRVGNDRDIDARRSDGTSFAVEAALGPSTVDGRPIAVVIVRDVSERRVLEQRFRQTQKLEAIGSLAGGIAHDFNNLLSIILSYSSMLLADLEKGNPMREDLAEIHSAALRAADLTRQLLAFGRKQILQPAPVSLNEIVQATQNMLRRLVGEDVEFVVRPAPQLGTTVVDPSQVEQIIMNLVVNARDAMPAGGKLTVETANVELDSTYAAGHAGVAPGAYVMLAISDNGSGMDAATQARVFEPFFTTKDVGKGTGLGLSTVFGIVKQSGGHIGLQSEVGKGTTVRVYFPRMDVPAAHPSIRALPSARSLAHETILIVEDEPALRALVATILRNAGYQVLEAPNGADALQLFARHGASIDLLVTDVVMPKMSGKQIADRLKALRPEIRVLYMSGYTDSSIVHHGVLDSDVAFLQKPITPETLVRKVREVLDG